MTLVKSLNRLLAGTLIVGVILSSSFLKGSCEETDYYEEIKLIVGDIRVIEAYSPRKVSIRDPQIADVKKATDKEIVIIAKAKGITKLAFWNKFGKQEFIIKVLPENIEDLNKQVKEIIQSLKLTSVRTKPLEVEGRILLLGRVGKLEDRERLTTALGELSAKTTNLIEIEEEELVEIAVEVVELQRGATKELGFDMPNSITVQEAAVPAATTVFRRIFRPSGLQRSAVFSWKIDMLEQEGKAKILSRPRIVCQSGKEAEMLIGGEVPVFTSTVSSTGTTTDVEYKEYGIKLNISPLVKESGKIQLSLAVEISEIGTVETIGSADAPTAKAYPLTKRNISTQLSLADGETLVIGGLIKNKTQEDLEKFPWLGDIPILGAFFRHKEVTKGGGATSMTDTELFIALTPRIIQSKEKLQRKEELTKNKNIKDAILSRNNEIPQELQSYVLELRNRIADNISYPAVFLNSGWGGTVNLKINITQYGKLKDIRVIKSSGYKVFDDDAVKLVKNLSFRPLPVEVDLEELKIEIPIIYRESD